MTESLGYRRSSAGSGKMLRAGWELVRERYGFFLLSTLVTLLVGSMVPFELLTGAAMCGIQLSYLEKADGREPTWETLLKGLDFFLPSLVATLITTAAFLVASLPFFAVFGVGMYEMMVANTQISEPWFNPALFLPAAMLTLLIAFLLQVELLFFFMFAYVLIVDKGLGGFRSLVVSSRAVWANFGSLVSVLMLLSALLLLPVLVPMAVAWTLSWLLSMVVGLLVALLVTVVTLPLLFGVVTVAYREIFPAASIVEKVS